MAGLPARTRRSESDPADTVRGFSIRGARIHAATSRAVESLLKVYIEERKPRQFVTVNVDFLAIAKKDPAMTDVINSSSLAVTDGVPLVWTARLLGLSECDRITGSDMVEAAARLSRENGYKIYLLGGTQSACEATKQLLEERFPGVKICGFNAPPEQKYPFPEEFDREITDRIRACEPDVLFVGFGCPKQDFWIRDHLDSLGVPVSVGIGGTFNFFAGTTPRAPLWMQRSGLEWVFRLRLEPKRLWKRYILHDLPFIAALASSQLATWLMRRRVPVLRNSR